MRIVYIDTMPRCVAWGVWCSQSISRICKPSRHWGFGGWFLQQRWLSQVEKLFSLFPLLHHLLNLDSSFNGGVTLRCRFNKPADVPGTITKTAPDFCTVYVISKGKISTMRLASRSAPNISPLRTPIQPPSLRPPQPVPSTATNMRGL